MTSEKFADSLNVSGYKESAITHDWITLPKDLSTTDRVQSLEVLFLTTCRIQRPVCWDCQPARVALGIIWGSWHSRALAAQRWSSVLELLEAKGRCAVTSLPSSPCWPRLFHEAQNSTGAMNIWAMKHGGLSLEGKPRFCLDYQDKFPWISDWVAQKPVPGPWRQRTYVKEVKVSKVS